MTALINIMGLGGFVVTHVVILFLLTYLFEKFFACEILKDD